MSEIYTVILAAGKSTRYKGKQSKLLENLAGLPIITHVFNLAKKISGKNVIIVCNKDNISEFKKTINGCKFIIQKKQKGTADAILSAKPYLKNKDFLILFGDAPLVTLNNLKKLIQKFKLYQSAGTMLAFNTDNPFGYGRLKKINNKVLKVVEEINTNAEEKKITLCNSGIMIVKSKTFFQNLKMIKINNKKNERYLPDIFEIYYNQNNPFNYFICSEEEMLGINTIEDFVKADKIFQNNIIKKFLNKGVLIINPESSRFSFDTNIEKGVIIESNVVIQKGVKISKGCVIKSFSYLEGVNIKENCSIGPNARIRPKSFISKYVKIGNYVEIKNSSIGDSSSIAHLSYIGDTVIGKKVNIGAGTITCNYDGKNKHKTIINDGAFIGSNTSLIAPIKINKNSTIAAGSVVNKDIPPKNLAIERSKLKIIKKN
ncbi:MAG: UDP-N-acetylglucosamine diphosphorylase/glucosamine-1-phosphate N-acetyltransferase [Rickettsiales bacterium]|nr:UDP-N-acetylglucosamine diphosphorylase/glucosamine-1-phosphate N-acetyltransferase [Rickettsiales bacterium]